MAEVRVDAPSEEEILANPTPAEGESEPIDNSSTAPIETEGTPEGDSTGDTTDADLEVKIKDNQTALEDTSKVINDNKVLTDKGINFDTLTNEYNEKGALSEETYKALEEGGFPKSVVDAYIAGQVALADQYTNTVINYAGGQEGFTKVTEFIKAEGAGAVKAYNDLIDSGNLPAIKMYIEGVQAKMTLRNGTSNPSVLGGGSVQVGGYESAEAMMVAMNDKRYGLDAKYTQEVQTKMAKSQFIKFNR